MKSHKPMLVMTVLLSASTPIIDTNVLVNPNDFGLDDLSLAPIPVPAAVWLFGSGLLGLVGAVRRKKPVG